MDFAGSMPPAPSPSPPADRGMTPSPVVAVAAAAAAVSTCSAHPTASASAHVEEDSDDLLEALLGDMMEDQEEEHQRPTPPPPRAAVKPQPMAMHTIAPAAAAAAATPAPAAAARPSRPTPPAAIVPRAAAAADPLPLRAAASSSAASSASSMLSSPAGSWRPAKRARLVPLPPVPIMDEEMEENHNWGEDDMELEEQDGSAFPRFKLESSMPARPLSAAEKKKSAPKKRATAKRERSPSPSRAWSPVAAASSSAAASPSILDRLAERERLARAAPLASELDAAPFVLHDGSETDDAASGLIASVPASINSRLRPYQRQGIQWLFACWRRQEGGLLGDEMGLGKTIQVIGFLAALFTMRKVDGAVASPVAPFAPILLLTPATILTQWQQELRDWCPELRCRIAHGSDKAHTFELVGRKLLDVVITSYETALSQLASINRVGWSLAILDECHRLKNHEALSTIAFRNDLQLHIKIGLTGTALQNNYIELWALFDVLMPRGSQQTLNEFKKYYWYPIKAGQKYGASLGAIHLKDVRIRELNQWLSKVMLRREKKEVKLDLPKKEDHIVFCALTDMQIRVYQRMLASRDILAVLSMEIAPKGILFRSFPAHIGDDGCIQKCSRSCPSCLILPCLTYLGKIANHLGLLQLDHLAGDPQEERYRAARDGNVVAEKLAQERILQIKADLNDDPLPEAMARRERARLLAKLVLGPDADAIGGLYRSSSTALLANEETCGKLKALKTLLRIWYRQTQPRNKVLLFSNSTQVLDVLGAFTTKQGYVHRRIDGNTPNKKRTEIVKEFHKNDAIFLLLLSTRAGGVGLNLTCANIVIIFDPNWNPAADLQAQDRVYRIGQTKNCQVYRLISAVCVEEQVYLRQVYKSQLSLAALHPEIKQKRYFSGVMKLRNMQGELFGVRNLFDFQPTTGFSSSVMKRENELEAGYVIKVDTLRKLRDKADELAPPADAEGAALVPVAAAAAVAPVDAHDELPVLPLAAGPSPPPTSSASCSIATLGCGVADSFDMPPPPPPRDEKDLLIDEYALSFVPMFNAPSLALDSTQASQSPAVSEDEGEDDPDLSLLMRDLDDDLDDGDGGEHKEAPAAAAAPAGGVSRRPSNGPSSASISRLLSKSGMIAQHEFSRVLKGSRMEHNISATARKVYQNAPIPRVSGSRDRRLDGSDGTADIMRHLVPSPPAPAAASSSAAASGFSPHLPKSRKPRSSPPPAAAAAASSTAPRPHAVAASAFTSAPPIAASAPVDPRAKGSPSAAAAGPPPPGGSALMPSKMDAFAQMATRYGFASVSDFARHLKDANLSKADIASMIAASKQG